MIELIRIGRVVVVVAFAMLAVSGCAVSAPASSKTGLADDGGKLKRFISQLSTGIDMDYTPLVDAVDAAKRSDLTVVGKITGVSEGITISGPSEVDGVWNTMVTLEVSVDRVLGGGPRRDQLHVQVFATPAAPLSTLATNLPDASVLLVLEDITHWSPFPGASIAYPKGLSKGDALYTPYIDGVVFEDATGIRQLYLPKEEATTDWTGGKSFDSLAASVEAARVSP